MIRYNPLTGDPILFAPARAGRPSAFGQLELPRCPFCPGHEEDTPPEIARTGDPWCVRVFPNKYPSVEGAEVIVESAQHGDTFGELGHGEEVVRMYVERYQAHAGAAYTALFKNEGPLGGASIPHVHSQVMPLPFTPPRIERELRAFGRDCPLCAPAGHVIREGDAFQWLAPEGSSFAYQQWIVPKRHVSEMGELRDREVGELASLLRSASRAMLTLAESYNWMFVNFPRSPAAHWYVDLMPRLTAMAGLELGTGTFVEIIDPAAAALRLRETE
jgi:UDPglucose--hexose-1-phosphate uridylyltransferase